MLVAVGPMGFCLALMAFMPNLWTTALLVFAFFFAYYVYEPPYRGLYPDLLPEQRLRPRAGRAAPLPRRRARRRAHRRRPALPPLAAGAVPLRRRDRHRRLPRARALPPRGRRARPRLRGRGTYVRHSWRVLRGNPDIGRFLLANAAWEGTFAGARTFVVLYVTVGLGEALSVSTVVLAAVAGGYVVAALIAGPIGDRFGLARVITLCSIVYGTALLRRPRHHLARVVPRADLPRRHLRRFRDDARLGPPLQAHARGRPGRDLRARDHDEGDRPGLRNPPRRDPDRRRATLLPGHRRLPGAVADPPRADPARDAARRLADPRRGGRHRSATFTADS